MEPLAPLERAVAILRALRITEIQYSLSGGGDSGEVTLEHVRYEHGRIAHELPSIPIAILNNGMLATLDDVLENIVADAPEGDWVNNEGGQGTVIVNPFEDDEDAIVECDVTFNDYDDRDDDDFIDDDDDDPDDDPPPAAPAARAGEVAR